jgi:hypothetical protein
LESVLHAAFNSTISRRAFRNSAKTCNRHAVACYLRAAAARFGKHGHPNRSYWLGKLYKCDIVVARVRIVTGMWQDFYDIYYSHLT